ncbi:hypothetical protein LSAT2_021818, partial [Lamellibrachia satsuma]
MKCQLPEAARDKSLRRELRLLNMESPYLGYFNLRDLALQWPESGARPQRRRHVAFQYEVKDVESTDLRTGVRQQANQLQNLQD